MIHERRIGITSAHFPSPLRYTLEETSVNDSPLTSNQSKTSDTFAKIWADEETLVADGRSQLTPSQHVEQKLIGMLKASPLMVSHVQRRLKPGPR
jgi:hypothetical protein